jgi:hypothetical protein
VGRKPLTRSLVSALLLSLSCAKAAVTKAGTALAISNAETFNGKTAGVGRRRHDDAGDGRHGRPEPQLSRNLSAGLAGAHIGRKRDGFCQQLRLVKPMQRQPDGAFVLAQRIGDVGHGFIAVALAPDPSGKLVQATRAAVVIDQRFVGRTLRRAVIRPASSGN